MRRHVVLALLITVVACSLSIGQTSGGAVVGHGSFPVNIIKTLDSSKFKSGDSIELVTAGSFKLADGTLVPKGSKLTGKVVTATARSKGDAESELNLSFDNLAVANGKHLTVKGIVQAVFPPSDEPDPGVARAESTAAGGGIAGATVGITPNVKAGSEAESNGHASLIVDPKAVGVQGIRDLDLDKGVLRSKGKQVKLGNGVRMIVHVDILG